MPVYVIDSTIDPVHADDLYLALALGARIIYTSTQRDHTRVRGALLLSGLPLLPIATRKPTHSVYDINQWVAMQRKCVFMDANLDNITMPLLAFPEVRHFVLVNWQARKLDAVSVKQTLARCGLRLVRADGQMVRFVSARNQVVDVYLGVEYIADIRDKLAGFTDIFVTDRLPGPALTAASAPHVQVGSNTEAAFQREDWLDSAIDGYVLLDDSMQTRNFTDFSAYKHHRDSRAIPMLE